VLSDMQEQDLFKDYEIKSWEINAKTGKILGIAAALHLFALLIVGQLDLLQTKACDSPYVGKVCQVLDTAYVGSILFGTDTNFVSEPYAKTEISDGDDITFVDVSGEQPKFTYPDGYFASSETDQTTLDDAALVSSGGFPNTMGAIPGITDSSGNPFGMSPQVLPKTNNNPVTGTLPTTPYSVGGANPTIIKPGKTRPFYPKGIPTGKVKTYHSPGNLPDFNDDSKTTVADVNKTTGTGKKATDNTTGKTANKTEDKTKTTTTANNLTGEEGKDGINTKPFKDLGIKYVDAIQKKDIDINAPFVIQIAAKVGADGKLVNPTIVDKPQGDPKLIEVAKDAVSAFSDSRLLKVLYDGGARSIQITFAQDKDNLQAILKTDMGKEQSARSLQSAVNLALTFKAPKEGSDEAFLMNQDHLKFDAVGKFFIINFVMPNSAKSEMIEKNLKGLKEELEKKSQPNSGSAMNTAHDRHLGE
jgi:hypothetical protein